MLLRDLINIEVSKTYKIKQDNGSYVEKHNFAVNEIDQMLVKKVDNIPIENLIKKRTYKVQIQELNDLISANIYGANIQKMLRLRSPLGNLEKYLNCKVNNTSDNISKYFIFINDNKYKIKSVNSKGIEIELI